MLNETVSLTDPTNPLAEITRRQRLAEILQQQAIAPIEVGQSRIGPAPISWTQVLAKALAGGLSGYEDRKAGQEKSAIDAKAQSLMDAFNNGQQPQAPPHPMPGPIRNDDYAGAAAMGPPPQPFPAPSPIAGPPPQAMAPPAQPVPVGPSAVAPPPDMAAQAPPQAAPAPPVDALAAQEAAAQAKLNAAVKLQQQMIALGHPKAADSYVETARKDLERVQNLRDTAASHENDRLQDLQHATQLVPLLPVTPEQKALLTPLAQVGGMKVIMPALEQLQKNALGPHEQYLAPDEVVKMGFNPGSIVSVNDVSHAAKLIFDPTPTKQAQQRIGLEAQNVGLSGARLGLERQRLAMDQEKAANAVLDPSTVRQMAQQALAGDASVLTNLGRGAQGAQNIVALRNEMTRQASMMGWDGSRIAAMNARFFGQKAEARAAGTRVGATDVAVSEVPGLAQEALTTHAAVPQTNLVPLNRALQMVQSGTSSPELAQAVAANQALINAYARSFGTGVTSDNARREAQAILQNAWGTPAYAAAVQQIQRNTQIERHGAKTALENMGTNAPAPMPPPRVAGPGGFRPPPGSMWSPSRQQYKLPNGQIVDATGRPVGG